MTLPPPSTYGLPEDRFSQWRPFQDDAVVRAISTSKRFVVINAPTGFGKTPVGISIARLIGGRGCYVVETKPLQRQIDNEMAGLVFDVRGKGNYDCHLLNEQGVNGAAGRCDRAEALCDQCVMKEKGCAYFDKWRGASRHDLVLTNYSYWLAINQYNEQGLGKFDCLILDESHSASEHLSKSLRVELSAQMLDHFNIKLLSEGRTIAEWAKWAGQHGPRLAQRAETLRLHAQASGLRAEQAKEMRQLKVLVGSLGQLAAAGDDWIEDRSARSAIADVAFEPVWPARYGERLFRGIPKIVMMSATINLKSVELLGVPREEVELIEFPSSFPIARRPVVYVPTVQMRAGMSGEQLGTMVRRVDQVIDRRLDRNGIIPTVSFQRAKDVLRCSRHADIMMLNESKTTQTTVDRFKGRQNSAPAVLVSPSVATGYDFPGTEAEYIIIIKIPFPDTRGPVMKARQDADKDYGLYVAALEMVQTAGRAMRSENDSCEIFVLDDQWAWARWKMREKGFLPAWFDEACRGPESLPAPLAKLEG